MSLIVIKLYLNSIFLIVFDLLVKINADETRTKGLRADKLS